MLGKRLGNLILIRIDSLIHSQGFVDIEILEPAMLIAHYPVGLSCAEEIRRHCSHHRRIDAILAGGVSASLHVPQYGSSRLNSRSCLNPAGHTG